MERLVAWRVTGHGQWELRAMAEKPQIVVSKTRARQGITPHVTRYVLGWGLGGVIVLFAVVYLVFFAL